VPHPDTAPRRHVQRMNIVMLAPFGIRPKGTLAARMLPLAQALVRRGHCVTILAPPVQNPEDAGRREAHGGVTVAHTPLPSLPGPASAAHQVAMLLRPALAARPDVLHLFKPKGYGGLAALLARALRPGLPLALDMDDWEGWGGWNDLLPYPAAAKRLFAWQERDLPRRAAAVTAASRTLQSLAWSLGVAPERVFYLPNGAPSRSACSGHSSELEGRSSVPASSERKPPNVLLYTRFWEFSLPYLVAALVGIAARRPDARLLVVGQGERGEERELLRLAARAGVASMVDCRGWAEPSAIPGLLAAADVALVPLDDTLINRARSSAKLLELLAAGLPVVAGRVGEAGEYIEHGVSGLLIPPGDPGALAAAALRLLDDPALRARLSAGARTEAARRSWERLAPVAEAAYQRARRG
jgi:glycosyltransferase involved in cell wall biosynthesis